MLLQLSHFPPLFPSMLHVPSHQHSPTLITSMGRTYKFFGYYICYTILNLPLSILYLTFMLLIPCTFSPILPASPSLLITLHAISISVIQFLF